MNGDVFLFSRKTGYRRGHKVLEIGSLDVNGSVRENFPDAQYIGIDFREGPGVDIVMDACDLPSKFPAEHFDIVLCLETLEHCERWQDVLTAAWTVLKTGGRMCVTTPTRKKGYHGYPHDYWRFELNDYRTIFHCQDVSHAMDLGGRGIGVIVQKVTEDLELNVHPWKVPQPK